MNSTQRFSDRVENYVRFRPHYPREIVGLLQEEFGLDSAHIIADVGSGTGISTELFLQNGNLCFAIEPNREMHQAAEVLFSRLPNFRSVDGTAENTTLTTSSVDWLMAGQAFHWFDASATRLEWQRILKIEGRVLLMWNKCDSEASGLSHDYDALMSRHIENYDHLVHHRLEDDQIEAFFASHPVKQFSLPTTQTFDFDSLLGRVLSSSYVPQEGEVYKAILSDLKALFARHERDGQIEFLYRTQFYVGTLKAS